MGIDNVDDFINDVRRQAAIENGEREEFILFTEDEYNRLFVAASYHALEEAGEAGMTEDELEAAVMRVVRWAEGISVCMSMIKMSMEGLVDIDFKGADDIDPLFGAREHPLDVDELLD